VALGFGVVHNTMGIVNFTQVDFVSLGGMILYSALVSAGLPMAPALLTAVAIVGLVLFFRKTTMGLAMRGVAANTEAAAVVGLKVWRVKAASFALAGALGGLAGCLVTPITTLSYDVGVLLGLKGFAAAILGGFGSFPGAILGGLILGLLESLGAAYISSAYKDVIAFIVLLLVLFIRPRGLLGGTG
jgi:branched-chain amino acid transport system permease protein